MLGRDLTAFPFIGKLYCRSLTAVCDDLNRNYVTDVTGQGCGKQAHTGVEVEGQIAKAASGDDLDEIVGKEAVGLEESSGADPVGSRFRLIG